MKTFLQSLIGILAGGWWWLAAATMAAPVGALRSADESLTVQLGRDGRITEVRLGEVAALHPVAVSGLEVTDLARQQTEQIRGQLSRRGDTTVFRGRSAELQLQVTARWRATAGAVFVNVALEDLTKTDRAVVVRLVLNLADRDWLWCHDLNETRSPKPNERCVNSGAFAGHDQPTYPFAAVATPAGQGLAVGWPMSNPRFYSLSYTRAAEGGGGRLELAVDLGLSPATRKFPSRADFDAVIFAYDGHNRFRGALSKYYELFPESFRSTAPRGGLWALWVNEGVFDWAKRAGVAYNQAEYDLDTDGMRLLLNRKYGLLSFQYTEPWAFWHPAPRGWVDHEGRADPPTDYPVTVPTCNQPALRQLVEADLGSTEPSDRFPGATRDEVARAILNSAIEVTPSGRWAAGLMRAGGFGWGARKGSDALMLTVNPDPDLPHPNRDDISWKSQIEFVEKHRLGCGARLDGVYLDSLVFSLWDRLNFRRDHWACADLPLTFTRLANGQYVPVQALALANIDFLRVNQERARARGYSVLANSWHPLYAIVGHYVDIFGAGEFADPKVLVDLSAFSYLRCLANRKPVSTMDYVLSFEHCPPTAATVTNIIEPRINHYLMYGIYPGTANAWCVDRLDEIKLMSPVFEKYVPICDAINRAGWEPVTRAQVDSPKVLVERWGSDPAQGLYFTLYNSAENPQAATVALDPLLLANRRLTNVVEVITGQPCVVPPAAKTPSFVIQLPPRRTAVVKLDTAL